MKTILIIFLISILVYSCDKPQAYKNLTTKELSRKYDKSLNEIWNIINTWCLNNNAKINFKAKNEGLFHFEIQIPDSLIEKYTDYNREEYFKDFYNVNCNIYILIKQIDKLTQVDILASFKGKIDNQQFIFKGQKSETDTIIHYSSGMLEKEILDFISKN